MVGYLVMKSLLSGFVCGILFILLGFIVYISKNNMVVVF